MSDSAEKPGQEFKELVQPEGVQRALKETWRMLEIQEEIDKLEGMTPLTITEISFKEKQLALLNKELMDVKARFGKSTQNSNEPSNPIPDKDRITSTIPFNQAIEKMYRHYYNKGEYNFIAPDYVGAFIQTMSDLLKKETSPHPDDEKELINYLAEHIKTVKKVLGAWKITTQEMKFPAKGCFINTAESTSYDKDKVSKKLCLLRKKYPIPCTIPIP